MQWENQGIFFGQNKKNCKKKFILFFQHNSNLKPKMKILIFKTIIVLNFYYRILIFGLDISVSIFENLNFGTFWGPAHCLYHTHFKTPLNSLSDYQALLGRQCYLRWPLCIYSIRYLIKVQTLPHWILKICLILLTSTVPKFWISVE